MKRTIRNTYLILMDIILLSLSIFLAFLIRFEGVLPKEYVAMATTHYFNVILIKIVILYFFRLYNSLWIYASIEELMEIFTGAVIANGAVLIYMFFNQIDIPRSIYIITTLLDIMLLGGFRLSYRIYRKYKLQGNIFKKTDKKRIMIIGAGDAGAMIIKELRNHTNLHSEAVAIIDDDIYKKGKIINGVPVVGGRDEIIDVCKNKKIDEIIIAIPSATKREISEIVKECKRTDAKLKILPGVYEIIDGKVNISQIREVGIEDLLGRDEVVLDKANIRAFLHHKTVMITGGAGSIGSELARQIATYEPRKLILFDINENGLYDIEHELNRIYNQDQITLDFEVIIASIRDCRRLEEVFDHYRPQVVFHAAAHKHVPLMEKSPHEAIKNNVFGTLNLVVSSQKYGVEKFVQISTDKAVNPTSVMGVSKRICEKIIQNYNSVGSTEFAAVRFGNVLGSNGSVIPLFKKQIADGGPITVTHPEIIRYFMTIPEAAQLVMQAGAIAKGGEIFILDMGDPVKIIDLARDLIKLSGLVPYDDIDIKITGLRPGEKLYEELLLSEEGITQTTHQKIYVAQPINPDINLLKNQINTLKTVIHECDEIEIRKVLKDIVPEYMHQ
ncbi:MAG: polysaccharide biosynthesis protein [Tissierellales bacterium]|nr:polysaccharide biosynthesis protein [Tissierellales bacterium]MBN2826678.1 polysaccharide biosynthesis protein [Tissierellales bacterium]